MYRCLPLTLTRIRWLERSIRATTVAEAGDTFVNESAPATSAAAISAGTLRTQTRNLPPVLIAPSEIATPTNQVHKACHRHPCGSTGAVAFGYCSQTALQDEADLTKFRFAASESECSKIGRSRGMRSVTCLCRAIPQFVMQGRTSFRARASEGLLWTCIESGITAMISKNMQFERCSCKLCRT